jgi:hypothetical protein
MSYLTDFSPCRSITILVVTLFWTCEEFKCDNFKFVENNLKILYRYHVWICQLTRNIYLQYVSICMTYLHTIFYVPSSLVTLIESVIKEQKSNVMLLKPAE